MPALAHGQTSGCAPAGGVGGLIGAAMALFFMQLHRTLKRASHAVGLHEHKTPVLSGRHCRLCNLIALDPTDLRFSKRIYECVPSVKDAINVMRFHPTPAVTQQLLCTA